MTKEGLSFGDEDVADMKKREKHYKKVFTPLAEHLKEMFKGKISKVRRLPNMPPARYDICSHVRDADVGASPRSLVLPVITY